MKRNIEGSAKFESKLFKSNISAVVYCRISSKEQSLDMQEMKCIEYAKENGYNVIKIVKEISSARSFSKLNNLKSLIKSISDVNIIVYSIDRFCRNTMDMLNVMTVLEANNINMVSVVDHINMSTAAGRHAFRQRVSAAELESDLIAERVNRSVEYKKSLGHIFGVAPYGYSKKIEVINNQKICKELQENSEEQKMGYE